MGCASSSHVIGQLVVSLTPSDNLEVGSMEFVYTIDLNEKMFSKPKQKPKELKPTQTVNEQPNESTNNAGELTVCIPLPQLTSPITKIQVTFQISKSIVLDGNTTMEIALTRDENVVYAKTLISEGATGLSSVTYGSNTGNPVVNLSQAGDVYQIRICHKN